MVDDVYRLSDPEICRRRDLDDNSLRRRKTALPLADDPMTRQKVPTKKPP
jgi:hypothetical protein